MFCVEFLIIVCLVVSLSLSSFIVFITMLSTEYRCLSGCFGSVRASLAEAGVQG